MSEEPQTATWAAARVTEQPWQVRLRASEGSTPSEIEQARTDLARVLATVSYTHIGQRVTGVGVIRREEAPDELRLLVTITTVGHGLKPERYRQLAARFATDALAAAHVAGYTFGEKWSPEKTGTGLQQRVLAPTPPARPADPTRLSKWLNC